MEKVRGEFRLREDLVPQEVGEGIVDAVKDGKEVVFESADVAFGYVAAMESGGTSCKVQFQSSTMV